VQGKVARNLPGVLCEQRKLLVSDLRKAGLIEGFALRGRTVLQEEEQWTACGRGASRAACGRNDERAIRALLNGRPVRDVVHEADRTIEDVPAGEEPTEDLRVLGMQPLTAHLEGMLAAKQ